MVISSNASYHPKAAFGANREVSPFFSTTSSVKEYHRKKYAPEKIKSITFKRSQPQKKPRSKPSPANLQQKNLQRCHRNFTDYLQKALPQSYAFYSFSLPKPFFRTSNISKNANHGSPLGFMIQRPAPLSEIFIFIRTPQHHLPLESLDEIYRLKRMGKIVLSVQREEDLAFHLKNLGIGLLAFPQSYYSCDVRQL